MRISLFTSNYNAIYGGLYNSLPACDAVRLKNDRINRSLLMQITEIKSMKHNLMNTAILIALLVLVTGCAPDVRTTAFQKIPPKHENAPIKIFSFKLPQCIFEEIGFVNVRQPNKFISMDEVMRSLLVEVRRLGGDAVIGLNETNPIHSVRGGRRIDRDPVLSGTVIKFTDPYCTN